MSTNNVKARQQEYVFGPVPSRRLGRSLGIDLVPFKTCTYDCIYCQLGRTTQQTVQRKEWVPLDVVMSQIRNRLNSKPDYITLSGSGEPTLYARIGELIEGIRELTTIPVAVLTNGSLLWMPDVRGSIMQADLVIPSLDVGSYTLYQYINRPHRDISFDKMLRGLIDFRNQYQGQYWLEVLLLGGVTTTEVELDKLSGRIRQISPDRVQVNTVTRPPAEAYALPVPEDLLAEAARQLADNAEIIADYRHVHSQTTFAATRDDILQLLQRRPCSIEDIAEGLGLHWNEVVKYLEDLTHEGRIHCQAQNNHLFYTVRTAIASVDKPIKSSSYAAALRGNDDSSD